MDQLSKATIVYSGFETKSGMSNGRVWNKYKIKDENNKTYSFFQSKQDGTNTVAYDNFTKLQVGDKVQVSYSEEHGEFNGKPVTYRTAKILTKVSDNVPVSSTSSTASGVSVRIAPDALQSLIKRVEVLEGLMTQIAGERAVTLHSGLHDTASKDKTDTIPVIEPGINVDEIPF